MLAPPTTAQNLINLQSLIDLSAALNASDDEVFILNTALLSVMGKVRTFKASALTPVIFMQQGQLTLWKSVAAKGVKMPAAPFELDIEALRTFDANNLDDTLFMDTGFEMFQLVSSQQGNTEEHLAILCFGSNVTKVPYSDEERQYISLVGSITANALLNARNVRFLRETGSYLERKNQLLTTLFEINREFTALLQKDEILKFLTLRLMGQLTVSRFAVLLRTPQNTFEIAGNRLKLSEEQAAQFAERFLHEGEAALQLCSQIVGECVLAVPMNTQNETKGLLLLGAKMNRQSFTAEEENFLIALGGTAMTALENARLFHEELEKKRLEDELNLAHTIQKGLLPQELPRVEGVDIVGMSVSSKQIGGDYYDLIPLGNDEWMIVIADVSGKGTPAALLMANTQAALRALAPLNLPLPLMVTRINDLLYGNTSGDKFVTFFCGKLNTAKRTFTFTNAGHNPPMLLRSDGSLELLSEGGLILGIMEAFMPYEEKTISLHCGDTLLLYTDGVSEALNAERQEFTEERLEAALRGVVQESSAAILERIVAAVEHHADGAPQSDDITMMVLKCL